MESENKKKDFTEPPTEEVSTPEDQTEVAIDDSEQSDSGAQPSVNGAEDNDQPEEDTPVEVDELEQAKTRAAENWDKFVRLQAEFENFKKRMHKEQSESLKYAQLPVLREVIGIMDNFERAVEHARNNPTPELEGIISGIDMVIQQMGNAFEKFGMTRIKSLGEAFDPTCHEAMSIKETDEVPENQVVEEFQPGYTLHDRVVRPAMVVVSKKPTTQED